MVILLQTIEWSLSFLSFYRLYQLLNGDKNVTTMSFAPKDEQEAQIQFALEGGILAYFVSHWDTKADLSKTMHMIWFIVHDAGFTRMKMVLCATVFHY